MTNKPQSATSPSSPEKPEAEEVHPLSPTGAVRVQKRVVASTATHREKLCANCGRPFTLAPEQKFYICPDCYQKNQPSRKPGRPSDAQLLIQIHCADCGTVEYVGFVPQDPQTTYCKSCFRKRKRQTPKP
jgi:CxxC-x17-CxxC domain-containing protein